MGTTRSAQRRSQRRCRYLIRRPACGSGTITLACTSSRRLPSFRTRVAILISVSALGTDQTFIRRRRRFADRFGANCGRTLYGITVLATAKTIGPHLPTSPLHPPPHVHAAAMLHHITPPSPLSPLTSSHHLTLPLNISLSPPFPPTLQPSVWSTAARPNPDHPPADPSCGPLPPPHLAHTRVYFHTRSHHS